jgi:glyoxylate reductase
MWNEENIPVPREVLAENIMEMDGLLCLLTDTIDEAILTQATKLKVISNYAVGTNNIDIAAATNNVT